MPPSYHHDYPYVPPPVPMDTMDPIPPPPPVAHKVWILDCKGCGMFLTNRGMKAVLLLRPNVPLYSTDALPINCSAYAPSSSVRVPPPTSGPPVAPTATVDGPLTHPDECPAPPTSPERTSSRSCECLTQTLCCHGCGTPVGYMIVSPCRRCTSSISVSNRTTNGHRFVFYSAEVTAEERHYVAGERGVIPFHPPATAPTAQSTAVSRHPGFSPALFYTYTMGAAQGLTRTNDPASTSEGRDQLLMHATESMSQAHSRTLSATSSDSMPPLMDPESPFRHVHSSPPSPSRPSPPPPTRAVSSHPTNAPNSPHLDVTSGPPAPPEAPVRLRVGEVLHWHNLVRSGEIPPVCDDARARRKGLGVDAKSCAQEAKDERKRAAATKPPVFAGR
ncbi:hypothetical protein POSPLADRAFT_1043925 [Postia placenta MAD-698-R-SB12]|uniref:Uncharacterized protein n=1 Tax=Postia placenta MAD-698-R-SB12 TaxID=670580 RepID=A0A1X6NDC1_9APHY|nr:hypothetical protein POSPLADRAFT_1043925 [Postia placenta MAD-698-R-SB12]OSX66502.1 hypothetical protein POSPLADRAFT_1043925 [Postia placenta MAD-698-R-SB12]